MDQPSPSCCTEIKKTILHHSWTIKNFSTTTFGTWQSAKFSGNSAYSLNAVTLHYQLTPNKTSHNGYACIAIEAFADATLINRTRFHANIVIECNNANVPNPSCSGTVQPGARIGGEMQIRRDHVTSYMLQNDTLTLRFTLSLHEEIRNGVPELAPTPQPDAKLLDDFTELLSCKKFSDVTLTVGNDHFFAHKAILSIRCPVFGAMFEHDMLEAKENKVKITDIKPAVFGEVLRFIYTGTVQKLELMAGDLLAAADKYALDNLKSMCGEFLAKKLSVGSAASSLRLADLYNAEQLKEQAINFISKNLKDMKTTDWKSVIASNPDVAAEMITQMAQDN